MPVKSYPMYQLIFENDYFVIRFEGHTIGIYYQDFLEQLIESENDEKRTNDETN